MNGGSLEQAEQELDLEDGSTLEVGKKADSGDYLSAGRAASGEVWLWVAELIASGAGLM